MEVEKKKKSLAFKMIIALICGLIAGFGCILLRENLIAQGQGDTWNTINNFFFKILQQREQIMQ